MKALWMIIMNMKNVKTFWMITSTTRMGNQVVNSCTFLAIHWVLDMFGAFMWEQAKSVFSQKESLGSFELPQTNDLGYKFS